MACKVVCISCASGAGGEEIGKLVAERLGFTCTDEEVVARAAARGGIDAGSVADEEKRRSRAARVLQALALSGDAGLATGVPLYVGDDEPTSAEVRALIRETIEHLAAQGNVVIVAHAASHALPGRSEVLRVLITASPEVRARRIGDSSNVDGAGAARAVKESDAARRDYLRRFYDVKDELPTQYDLVLNTDFVSVERAVELIAFAASSDGS
ncbi:MAG TPA: cytidylate kinase-like family protein [Gaiellaceae bacterium]